MNQACPSCGTLYAVSDRNIGRAFTCRKCETRLVVTDGGVAKVPPEVIARPAPPSHSRSKLEGTLSLDGDESDDDTTDSGQYRGRYRRKGRGGLIEFLTFRRMVIPIIIQVIFWLMVLAVVLVGMAAGISLMNQRGNGPLIGIAAILFGIPLYILLVRMYCELIIVVFRINDTLTDIKNLLGKR
jgi:hypothetical protein